MMLNRAELKGVEGWKQAYRLRKIFLFTKQLFFTFLVVSKLIIISFSQGKSRASSNQQKVQADSFNDSKFNKQQQQQRTIRLIQFKIPDCR